VELQWELEETNSDQSILKNCATKLSSTFTSGSHMYRMSHKSRLENCEGSPAETRTK